MCSALHTYGHPFLLGFVCASVLLCTSGIFVAQLVVCLPHCPTQAGRDLGRTWLHVDMDAFYAAVEELERPELRTIPMAVGGMGMITTANYEVCGNVVCVCVYSTPLNSVFAAAAAGLNLPPHFEHPHYDQARKFGVRSAMPGFIARRLCPQVCRCNCAARFFPSFFSLRVCTLFQ